MNSGKTATVSDTLSGTGNWTGGNGVTLDTGAKVSPGNSIGILNNGGGKLTFSDGAIYEWQLTAATGTEGVDWDLLKGTGPTFLGNLIFKVDNSLFSGTLVGDEEFLVASFTSAATGVVVDGSSHMTNVSFQLPEGWSGGVLTLSGNDLILSGLVQGNSADINGDGVVDATDYIILKTHIGSAPSAQGMDGDLDNNNMVDYPDLVLFMSAINAGGNAAGGTIPEPATLCLLALGGLAVIRRRRMA